MWERETVLDLSRGIEPALDQMREEYYAFRGTVPFGVDVRSQGWRFNSTRNLFSYINTAIPSAIVCWLEVV